jgi:hypothetical protein
VHDGVLELQIGQRNERRQKIHRWLSPPDSSSNHNAACKKRQPTTGSWFVGGDQFAEWKVRSNSFLWLHGIRKYTVQEGSSNVPVTNRVSQLGVAKLFYGKYFRA